MSPGPYARFILEVRGTPEETRHIDTPSPETSVMGGMTALACRQWTWNSSWTLVQETDEGKTFYSYRDVGATLREVLDDLRLWNDWLIRHVTIVHARGVERVRVHGCSTRNTGLEPIGIFMSVDHTDYLPPPGVCFHSDYCLGELDLVDYHAVGECHRQAWTTFFVRPLCLTCLKPWKEHKDDHDCGSRLCRCIICGQTACRYTVESCRTCRMPNVCNDCVGYCYKCAEVSCVLCCKRERRIPSECDMDGRFVSERDMDGGLITWCRMCDPRQSS